MIYMKIGDVLQTGSDSQQLQTRRIALGPQMPPVSVEQRLDFHQLEGFVPRGLVSRLIAEYQFELAQVGNPLCPGAVSGRRRFRIAANPGLIWKISIQERHSALSTYGHLDTKSDVKGRLSPGDSTNSATFCGAWLAC